MKQLFCDCKTDEEKSNFFLSGRAVESGVIAPALVNDVAMAYHRCAEFKKETDTLRAELLEKLASANRAVEEAYQRGYATGQEEIEAERDALRAKITEMEEQEPAGTLHDDGYFVWRKRPHPYQSNYAGWKMALYALPGAKGETK